jgi:hypothetical protein
MPVTVEADAQQAAEIRRALGTLVAFKPPGCHENPNVFTIAFLRRKGSHRINALVTDADCPTPGVVTISEHGKVVLTLKESCAMRAAVLSVLPSGQARGTRRDRNGCSS